MAKNQNGNTRSSLQGYLLRKPIEDIILLEASVILERYHRNRQLAIQYVEDMHTFCEEQVDNLINMVQAIKPIMSPEYFTQYKGTIGNTQFEYWAAQCKKYSELKRALKQ